MSTSPLMELTLTLNPSPLVLQSAKGCPGKDNTVWLKLSVLNQNWRFSGALACTAPISSCRMSRHWMVLFAGHQQPCCCVVFPPHSSQHLKVPAFKEKTVQFVFRGWCFANESDDCSTTIIMITIPVFFTALSCNYLKI